MLVLLCHTNIGVVDMTKELIIVLLEVCMCTCVYMYEDAHSVDIHVVNASMKVFVVVRYIYTCIGSP